MAGVQLDFLQITFLALVQGLTEFLPISSSAHLILPGILLDWPDQGLTFDVAVHVGSLLAVLAYFQRDVRELLWAWLNSLLRQRHSDNSRLAWYLLLATVPAGIAGLLLNNWVEQYARSALVIGTTSIVFALLLLMADRRGRGTRSLYQLNWRVALIIGLAQAVALIPGTSRSGITMTAALFCQLSRHDAARFSFLLAIPTITASGMLRSMDMAASGNGDIQWLSLLYAVTLAAIVAYACIHLFLRLIERMGFMPFVAYRLALGAVLLGIYWL